MLRAWWLAAPLLSSRADASNGNSKCPCLSNLGSSMDSYKDSGNSACINPATDDGATYCYPVDFGGLGCKSYEDTLPPTCAVSSGGAAVANRPGWCADQWCFVDKDNCDSDYIDDMLPSILFPNSGLHFSYATCGFSQTFAKWQFARNQTALQLKETAENYMKNIRDEIEQDIRRVAGDENPGGCEGATSLACECSSCKEKAAWTDQTTPRTSVELDFMKSNTLVASSKFKNQGNEAMNKLKCTAGLIGKTMRKVALREYNDVHRIAYMYYGSQSTGAMVQWPASKDCSDFDSRMRPWYATAASGPKDVVIVLDKSGSMNTAGRWPAVQNAAKKVLLTLGAEDYANVVTFSSQAAAFDEENGIKLHRITATKKERMEKWLDIQSAVGGTNFRSGLEKAGRAFLTALSGHSSSCTQILIFLTDGIDTEGFKASQLKGIGGLEGVHVFTYSFGSNIGDQQVAKKMACQNQGIWHTVADGGDIATTMASYYQIFAASLDAKSARWVEYSDALTGTDLVAACYSVYDRTSSVKLLNGVACMDLNVIVDLQTFKGKDGYADAWKQMRDAATSCSAIKVSNTQFSTFRALQGGDCRACDMTDENCPVGVPGPAASSGALSVRPLLPALMVCTIMVFFRQ
eukprot:TRINITY_DN15987_c0_g1_i5.p1 TRINITY_DN15987_c0_g1~~TRINITY_DN15987_c0_g1_i5.p1  ORF type:complete len:633 (-),score=127.58 TRINITY_DN15987_c0_g1_i5:265-2163(-)